MQNKNISEILKERGDNYGEFKNQAALSQHLNNTIINHIDLFNIADITYFKPYMLESIKMITHKLARIANGNPNTIDSWKDIAGYAELVVKELENENS